MNAEPLRTVPYADDTPPVVLITGSGAGIGAACAGWFAESGWLVLGVDLGAAPLPLDLSRGHVAIRGDVTADATWAEAAERLGAMPGRLRAVVNNAAHQLELPLLETSVEDFSRVLDVNVVGMFRGLRFADAHLADGGAVVNMGSILGFTADPVLGAYSASKGAVINLTRAAALAFAPRGIRVNAVCPGAVRTPLTTRVWDLADDPDQARRQMESLYPLGRIAEPGDIAELVGFLAGPASRSMTGSLVVADGGLTATNAEYAFTAGLR
ncbi:SDR family oxidoreductase [Microbispora siamensis]|uniref:Dehydrogenase n=1 Tax=Microbispora siamensis TaxID=564413 RepID=A0ABQ4GRS6_9ACTN|nr:SDR family oxidoreductase [Microbispora siamensis]GIH64127.1 dehydrogenase [Microbispora siamensis]